MQRPRKKCDNCDKFPFWSSTNDLGHLIRSTTGICINYLLAKARLSYVAKKRHFNSGCQASIQRVELKKSFKLQKISKRQWTTMSWTQKGPNFSKAEHSSPSVHLFSATHTLVFNGGLHEKHQRYSSAFTCKQSITGQKSPNKG